MRTILSLAAVLVLLALPAAVSAHVDYYNVTLDPNEFSDSGTVTGGIPLGCFEATDIQPGQTKYVFHGEPGPDSVHFGLGEWAGGHIHPADGDFDTGIATRAFHFPSGTNLGTRREVIYNAYTPGGVAAVKFVNQGGYPIVVRGNC